MNVPSAELRGARRESRPEQPRPVPAPPVLSSLVRKRLAIVGHGMVGHYLRERACTRGLLERYDIESFGDEPHPAYDRVKLGELLEGRALSALELAGPEGHLPPPRLGARVVTIDKAARELELADGARHRYDVLVLATGARPVLPQLPGAELDGVLTYRSAEDALRIRREALACAERGSLVLVAGAGLLGLELAEQLVELGAPVTVVESGRHLLPRQLDARAAAVVQAVLERRGLVFLLERRVVAIEAGERRQLSVRLSGADSAEVGLVIFAVGVRPRDELARAAGLACDLFGGVVVDSRLRTSDDHIFAIGDCARFQGTSYGLVAPGYDMADVVLEQLLGGDAHFSGAEPATRLKTKTVEVFSMGEAAQGGSDLRSVVWQGQDAYRRLSVRGGRIVGASAVGAWREIGLMQQAVARQLPLRRAEEKRFISDREVWAHGRVSLELWPDSATVCSCTGVTCGTLKRAFAEGHRTVEALSACTRASSVCGSCRPLLESLVAPAELAERPPDHRALFWISAFGALMAAAWFLAPPIPYSTSVTRGGYDALWREPWLKQLTGFSLAALLAAGSLLSLRKRWPALRRGSYAAWRLFHAFVSVTAAGVAVAHTGFRLGANFNAVLMVTFLVSAACGALAGLAAVFEPALPPGIGQRLRSWANRVHLYAAWPLPLFITFHVLKFYYF